MWYQKSNLTISGFLLPHVTVDAIMRLKGTPQVIQSVPGEEERFLKSELGLRGNEMHRF